MANPTITALPEAPQRRMARDVYPVVADKWAASLGPFTSEVNQVVTWMGQQVDAVATNAASALKASQDAATSSKSASDSASAASTSAGQAQTYAVAAQAAAGAPAIANKADQVLSVNANATGVEWRVTAPRPSASIAGKFVRYNAAGNAFEAADGVKYFESAQQLVSNTTSMNISHGLGVMPKGVSVVIVCLTAEFGYSVGDRLEQNIAYHLGFSGSNRNLGVSIRATSSQIMYKSSGLIMGYSASESIPTVVILTPGNWAVVVRAWA